MKNIWQSEKSLSFWLRSCCVCRLMAPPVAWLCSDCWKKLKSFYLSPQDMIREQEGLTHARLFDWNKENDFFIRLFLNSLKRGGPSFIFDKLMQDFLSRIIQVRPLPLKALLIPAPAHPGLYFKDHAFCLGSSFSRLSGLRLKNPLLRLSVSDKADKTDKAGVKTQKRKNRRERKKVRFCLKENSLIKKEESIIFIDDILTTGGTALAAYETSGAPKDFMIFTLAWRSDFI